MMVDCLYVCVSKEGRTKKHQPPPPSRPLETDCLKLAGGGGGKPVSLCLQLNYKRQWHEFRGIFLELLLFFGYIYSEGCLLLG